MDDLNIHRYAWIKNQVSGTILDVGCNDSSMWIHPGGKNTDVNQVTFFDCDKWEITWLLNPKFVQGDAHELSKHFKEKSFVSVVLGDILEHVFDPYLVLSEAVKVASDKVVLTVPDEYNWNDSLRPFTPISKYVKEIGSYKALVEKDTLGTKSQFARCTGYEDEGRLHKHLYHVRQFSEDEIIKLLDSTGLSYEVCRIWYNFGPDDSSRGCNFAAVIKVDS